MEIMIVMLIMGAIITVSMPYLSNRNSQTTRFLREFTVLSRELHTRAKLNGAVYRLVINLGGQDSGLAKEQNYWVEKGNASSIVKVDEEAQALEQAIEQARDKDAEKVPDPRGFEVDKSIMKAPRTLPNGLRFDKIELARSKTPIVEGKAYIHYLPQGLVDEAAIHIKGEKKQEWTISIHPLTGKAEIIQKPISLQELDAQ
jgi:general secretion pathway protein H